MQRQEGQLVQEKPWSELTEEERQVVRESWKHKLPKEFDVFCNKDCEFTENTRIPGRFYVAEDLIATFLSVKGECFIDGEVNAEQLIAHADVVVMQDVHVSEMVVAGTIIVKKDVGAASVTVLGDCFVENCIYSNELYLDGLLDCYDVDPVRDEIFAEDYVCRFYEAHK